MPDLRSAPHRSYARSRARSLGLGKYEALFRENDIDETVLPNLTAEDLKELGLTALGHPCILLDAIAALRADTGGKRPHSRRG